MGQPLRVTLAAASLTVISAVVVLALVTRDANATVRPGAGWLLVGVCGIAVLVAVVMIDSGAVLSITLAAVSLWSVPGIWATLRSDGSTAGVGVLWVLAIAFLMVLGAIAVDRLLTRGIRLLSGPKD